ncbi:MAG: hypothetical protein IRY83_06735 [Chloroflexi bacterium]|nr:hypothetical protein [Chloroflexota bacterium]
MAIAEARARLTADDLTVEAGETAETMIEVGPLTEAETDAFYDFTIQLTGPPGAWASLSTTRLRVQAGQRAEALLILHPPHDAASAALGEHDLTITLVPDDGSTPIHLHARVHVLPPGGTTRRSRLLEYLPRFFQSDEFLARFLLIFQSILDPMEQMIDNTHHYLDPGITPASFLPWLATWVGIELDPGLDEASQRRLIRRAVELSRWKGTRRGLREELAIRTGGRALIVENFDGMRLGHDASLGLNTYLGTPADQFVSVTLATDSADTTRHHTVDALVQELKPAHIRHITRVVEAPRRSGGGDHG